MRTLRIYRLAAFAVVIAVLLCGCTVRRIDEKDTRESQTKTAALSSEGNTNGAGSTDDRLPDGGTDADTRESGQGAGREISTQSAESGKATDGTEAQTAAGTEAPLTAREAPRGEYAPLVFMYHLILEEPYSPYEGLFVRPSEFSSHIEALIEYGYRFEFAEDYADLFEYPTAIVTLDDGYEDNYTEMFPILRRFNAKATVFLACSLVGTPGYLTEAQIKEMSDSGLVSFQSHTVSHVDLSYQSADFIERDTKDSISFIEGLTGKTVTAMAYPAGSFNETVMEAVGKDIKFAYTTEPPSRRSVDSPLAIPRIRINRGLSKESFEWIIGY